MATVAYMLPLLKSISHCIDLGKELINHFPLSRKVLKMVRDLSNIDKALGDGTKKLLEVEKDPMFKKNVKINNN